MVNKVRVTIAGAPYAIATTDSEKYIASLAKRLDEDITKLLDTNENLSVTKAAVFCAMDYLDEYKKSTGSAENMRSQIQDYIADAAKKLGGKVTFVDAVHYIKGEGIEKKADDFAAEVAAQIAGAQK